MRVVTYKNSGITYWSLANEQYIPVHPLVSHYLQVKNGGRSVNTKQRKAYELSFVFKYFQSRGIDLIADIEAFKLLSEKEISLFARACKFKVNVMEQNIGTTITKTAISNLLARNQPTANIVEEGTAKGRLDTFIGFYKYVYERRHGRAVIALQRQADYEQCLIDLDTARASMGSWKKQVIDPFCSRFSDEKYFELLEVIRPISEKNPFKNSRLRNELIIKVLIETGFRRGAVAKLKISDVFNDRVPRVRVTRTPDDMSDPRRDRASQKTKSHVSPISSELAKKLEYYIKGVRNVLPNTDNHEFVFVTEKNSRGTLGKPLTLRSYNHIFNVLSATLEAEVTPHTLRYKWNELFDDEMNSVARELGFDSKTIEDIRKYAMGWSAKSEMAEVYNNFKLASKAREFHLARQREAIKSRKNLRDSEYEELCKR